VRTLRSSAPEEVNNMHALVLIDDERREPMGLTDREQCRTCHGPITRTDLSGLCWICMPTH
jgi:hypothetical protein